MTGGGYVGDAVTAVDAAAAELHRACDWLFDAVGIESMAFKSGPADRRFRLDAARGALDFHRLALLSIAATLRGVS
ncbi:hypothetical protein Y710_03960 [Gordonia sp. QH-12]|nr:hypothetical protein Y710_03960 [Gordonia sp. QH-12]